MFFLNRFFGGGDTKDVDSPPENIVDPNGLHNLYPLDNSGSLVKTDIDIVAVHGLDGDPWRTWTSESSSCKVNWLKDFLPGVLPNARIMTFGYNSSTMLSGSVATIEDFGKELLTRIRNDRRGLTNVDRPLIFICHSLGGIVVKKALILAHEAEERFGSIKRSCKGIIFLGTPHRGSGVASLGTILSNIVNSLTLNQTIRVSLINDLRRDSGVLQTISRQFVLRSTNLEIISFYETEVVRQGGLSILVVNQDSATLGIPNENTIPMASDHRQMCRFSGKCQRYQLVQAAVEEMVNNVLKGGKNTIGVLQETELHGQILEWLDPEPIGKESPEETLYDVKLGERGDGTCCWFWKNDTVKAWVSGYSSILWVQGPPGVGKSVLCSSIVSKLLDEHEAVAYFLCTSGQQCQPDQDSSPLKLNSPEFIVRSLIVQLLERDRRCQVPQELKELYRQKKRRKSCPNTQQNLRKILQCILHLHPRAYIIIDGLDEVDELDQANLEYVDQLKKLFNMLNIERGGTIKWLFLSQGTRAVEGNLYNFKKNQEDSGSTSYHELDLAEVDSELKAEVRAMIKSAVERKFSDLPLWFESLVLPLLVGVSGGNFLCAKLLLDDLNPCTSLEDFADSVVHHKPGLENLYLRALKKMVSTQNPSGIDQARKTLMYILLALKHLTVGEVRAALGVDVAGGQCGKLGIFLSEIPKLCLPLVRVCPKNNTMMLVHHSVKAFLMKQLGTSESRDKDVEGFFVEERKGNGDMALVCLSYLGRNHYSRLPTMGKAGLPDTSDQTVTMATTFDKECLEEGNELMKYASIFWNRHADAADITPELARVLVKFLRSPNFITCLRVRSIYAPYHFGTFISGDGSSVSFADTIPGWLESTKLLPGFEGKEIAFQYYNFIKEWGHVLVRYPGEIEQCLTGTLGEIFLFPVKSVAHAYLLDGGKTVQSADVTTSNFTSFADLQTEGWVLTLKLKKEVSNTESGLDTSTQSESVSLGDTQSLELWRYSRESKPAPGLRWSIPDFVGFTSGRHMGIIKDLNCCDHPLKVNRRVEWPSEVSPLIASSALDYAILNGRLFRFLGSEDTGEQTLQGPLVEFKFPSILCIPLGICLETYGNCLVIGATWDCEKCIPDDDYFADEDGDDAESDNEDSSGVDSDADEDPPIFAGTSFASEEPTTSSAFFNLLVYDPKSLEKPLHEFRGYCRKNEGGNPFNYASPVFNFSRTSIAWAPGPGEIIIADLMTGEFEISRAIKISQNSHVIARELQFSQCGNFLYEVKITVNILENSTFQSGKIILTTFPVDNLSSPHSQIQYFSWKLKSCNARRKGYQVPTTTWVAGSVYISFNNLGLSVCRIDLLPDDAKLYVARTTMALPTSALQRSVRFIPLGGKDAIVILGGSVGFGPSLISVKGLLDWEMRAWCSEVNLTVTGGGGAGVFFECEEPSFIVPVRSGAVWTNRQVLRCR